MQRDPSNYMPDFGNPHANPVGYFVTHSLVGTAGQVVRAREIQLAQGHTIGDPAGGDPTLAHLQLLLQGDEPVAALRCRAVLDPVYLERRQLIGLALEASGVVGTRIFLDDRLLAPFGIAGSILGVIFTVNTVVIVILLLVSIPLLIFYRDVRKTLVRFDVLATIPAISPTDAACFKAAKEVFASDPETFVFIYGHTHNASLKRVGERVVINTGTWLKKLERVPARSRLLPSVYRPSFRLNYFCLSEDEGRITIDYERIRKSPPRELSLLQRLVARKAQRDALEDIPERTVIG